MTNKVTQMSCSDNHVAFCYKGKRIVVRFKEGEKITMDVHKDIGNEEPNQAEWKNGDECVYNGRPNLKCKFVGIHPGNKQCAIIWEGGGDINLSCVSIDCLSKPETPEQKAERERLEAAYDLYCECVIHGNGGPIGFETFKSSRIVNLTWLRIVDKTNYRKQ